MISVPRRALATALTLALALAATPAGAIAPGSDISHTAEEIVLCFADQHITQDAFAQMAELGVPAEDVMVIRSDMAVVTLDADDDVEEFARKMRARDDIEAIGPNGMVHALESIPPSDPVYTGVERPQRSYLGPRSIGATHSIEIEPVWDAIFNGETFRAVPGRSGVTVAVIDTGVTPSLVDDTGEYVPMWDYANNDADTRDDYYPYYHGTRVAQTIRARTDNGVGTSGLLYSIKARVLVYKSLNSSGSGTTAQSVQAMKDAADAGARIINMSLGERAANVSGTPNLSTRALWQSGIDYCVARGAVVVAASGNEADQGYTSVYYPAACEGALAVGSIDADTGLRSDFSCYGPQLDIVAPGQLVDSPPAPRSQGPWQMPPNGVPDTRLAGTSFAAPQVSGSLALLWSLVPGMSANSLTSLVLATADDTYGPMPGRDDETGWGLLNVNAAYSEMTRTVDVQDPVVVTATHTSGIEARLTWSAAEGAGVTYEYGFDGGPSYATTSRSGRLLLPGSGQHRVWVRAYATDRWSTNESGVASVTIPGALAPVVSQRLSGDDRYETAAAISADGFPSADGVVLAVGTNWPDALSASVLARAVDGPILLVEPTRLPIVTKDELVRLSPDRIYIVGGTSAVASVVESTVRDLLPSSTVARLAGSDRYDTARLIALTAAQDADVYTDRTVIVASGEGYADALAGAPVAAAAGWPILLTKSGSVPAGTKAALTSLKPTRTIVLGGSAAIGTGVVATLPSPTRWWGTDRYATSREIADRAFMAGILTANSLGISTGAAFPDALSAGPRAAEARTPMLLVRSQDYVLQDWLDLRGSRFESVTVHGGRSAIPYDVEFDILYALRRP